jgi:pimeloyl-ACP methyl ester carboxylesterase/predicted glycosyltransferase
MNDCEPARARCPDRRGFAERAGVRTYYEVHGDGTPAFLLLPPWSVVHSRAWKMQVPYLARHARVVTCDPRGNGRSDRPLAPEAYAEEEYAADALAVLDATGTERAVVVTYSLGAQRALLLAAEHPERVERLILLAPNVPLGPQTDRARAFAGFDVRRERYEGWEKYNRHHWAADLADFLEFFFGQVYGEPHSTKHIEDGVAWGREAGHEALAASAVGQAHGLDEGAVRAVAARVRCPATVVHGTRDGIRSPRSGAALAEALGAELLLLEGCGHAPHARDPVRVNLLLRELASGAGASPRRWVRARARRPRALYVSSPIGLGHARRDLAIAGELRTLRPELEIDWLAQHPVTALLEAHGERIHPASAELAGESAHIASEASAHDLPVFEAWRRMDEILLANFMVFLDVVREEHYDLWIGDEAWDLDHYLHENPELKTAAYAWLTDFVGWLPMPEGGERESMLTADYNAEMIEHIERFPRVRDRAIFVGEPEDVVADRFGPGLPRICDWTREHYRFAGQIVGLDTAALGERAALRARLGYAPGERVCVVSVGGSGVGEALLRRVADAFAQASGLVQGLRMILVAGPRIDAASLPRGDGLEVRGHVDDLPAHLAACDLAIVQGGLSTCMELTAARRPFLYFPLRRHFEQNLHVAHRLERHRAGRRMDYEEAGPSEIAAAIAAEIGREPDYLPVAPGGAARAAAMIAELL